MAKINVELIAPFITAANKTFQTMLKEKITRKSVAVKKSFMMAGDISAMIGMSGALIGTCSLCFPGPLAVRLIEKMIGEKVEHGINDVVVHDGVGELVNMITGDAKTALSETRYKFEITLPTIITGQGFEVYHRSGTRCVSIVFTTSDDTEFTIDIAVPVEQ